jgi:O-succinylbenzoic acid--CoA ligase
MEVQAWLERAATRRPDHPAVLAARGEVTYAELADRAARGARVLRDRGVAPGDRVAIALAPSLAFAEALHACLWLGAVAVPADPRDPAAPTAGARVVLDEPLAAGPAEPLPARAHDLAAEAIVVHTSGTTSAPKPVALTFGNWLWSALGSATALGHPRDERWLCALPLTHVGGLSILTRSVVAATTVLLHERWDTEAVLRGTDDATIVSLVPTTLARLLDAGLREPPALRRVLLGGAAIAPALLERAAAAGVPVVPTYGMTEACSQVATDGVPLFCTRVATAPGGELLVRGPTVAPGAAGADGWLRTGDLGAVDPATGRLRITGRAGDTIITGGENVAPAEVEAVLEAHPAVREALVRGEPDPDWGERVVAAVVLRGPATPEELRAHGAGRLAAAKVPKEVRVRAEPLPRTPSGKLRRS